MSVKEEGYVVLPFVPMAEAQAAPGFPPNPAHSVYMWLQSGVLMVRDESGLVRALPEALVVDVERAKVDGTWLARSNQGHLVEGASSQGAAVEAMKALLTYDAGGRVKAGGG